MRSKESRSSPSDLHCILCQRSEETETTGALSRNEDVAAHENCLLFSSGIFCRYSPTYDDLFGFDVDDVKNEVKRGRKLKCSKCKQNGATAGCEVKSCKRSYHYPCAMEAHAVTQEDSFKLYCAKHNPEVTSVVGSKKGDAEVSSSGSGHRSPETNDQNNSFEGSESDSELIQIRSCSRKRKYLEPLSDSDDIRSITDLNFAPIDLELEDTTPSNQNTNILDSKETSSNIKEPRQACAKKIIRLPPPIRLPPAHPTMPVYLPTPLHPAPLLNPLFPLMTLKVDSPPSGSTEAAPASKSGGGGGESGGDDDDDDGNDVSRDSDCESQSLLCTEYCQQNVPFTVIADSGPSIESLAAENSPDPCSPVTTSSADTTMSSLDQIALSPPTTAFPCPDSPSSGPTGESSKVKESPSGDIPIYSQNSIFLNLPLFSEKEDELRQSDALDLRAPASSCSSQVQIGERARHNSDAAIFWRRCKEFGCTEIIFTELKHQLSVLAERVQNQHASEEDYTVSLRILKASGKLPAILKQLEQDLEDQERCLQKKRDALRAAKAVLHENEVEQ